MPLTKAQKVIKKAYWGEKEPELGIWNVLLLRCLLDPR